MRNHNLNYVAVGGFVVAMLVALIATVSALTGRTGPTDDYHLVLSNVSDVKFGTQVRYEGFPIGQVERIVPEPAEQGMKFRLDVSIRKGWRLPDDSLARVGSSSLLAAKTIDIAGGKSANMLKPGAEIPSAPPVDMFSLVANVAGEFSDLNREGLKPFVEDLRQVARQLRATLDKDVTSLVASLNSIAHTVDGQAGPMSKSIETAARRLADSSENLNKILSADTATSLRRSIANFEDVSHNIALTTRELETTRKKVDKLLTEVDSMVVGNRDNVDKTLTNARYALRSIAETIDAVMANMDGASRNMNEFSRLIRQNPGLLLGGTPREETARSRDAERSKR
jgi:phospholipid/cholesterol/gamma-HCH transport system substrate-binding protein